ncbi:MAG TPA: hypothetical protein VMV52_10720 [Candidatus Nanopelagicaceae bacterium]|nr:hypothetical protein [Candidatus Nanopelagicaceae bacterium]
MEIEWGTGFENALQRAKREAAESDGDARERFFQLHRLLDYLRSLERKPEAESSRYKRVRQARRYELWRVAHAYHPRVAVRIIVWFPSNEKAVLALFAFDKAKLGDIWYDRATRESEAILDQWRREHPGRTEER